MKLFKNYDLTIKDTFIIHLPGNEISENLAERCLKSCQAVGQPNVQLFAGFDGTGDEILPPQGLNDSVMDLIRIKNH
jgi:hypothetical protein